MFDDEELAALDEWRFAMRMPSRAAAMRALMRFGLRLEVDVEDFGVDPASIASNRIGVVGGANIDPDLGDDVALVSALGDATLGVLRELAARRNVSLQEAIHQACTLALNLEPAAKASPPEQRSGQ